MDCACKRMQAKRLGRLTDSEKFTGKGKEKELSKGD
jgi:hypothetical protein